MTGVFRFFSEANLFLCAVSRSPSCVFLMNLLALIIVICKFYSSKQASSVAVLL